ncbi:MAG TPA: methyltransferase domain-containing protein [Synergistales bacterium]|nr:methyltransferase domain-containing protein [Synergistales bacterium]
MSAPENATHPVSRDELLMGSLSLDQPEKGPRVNADTILLASYVRNTFSGARGGSDVLEIGCATGAVSLILAYRFPEIPRIVGVDIQGRLVQLAAANAVRNGFADRVSFIEADVRAARSSFPAQSFDVVAANPPYESPGRGRLSATHSERLARQEVSCTLEEIAAACRYLLRNRGRLYLVFKAERACELFARLSEQGIEPKRVRWVHPLPGRKASVVLVEALRGGRPGMIVEPPLFIHDATGGYTEEFLSAYTKEGLPCCV